MAQVLVRRWKFSSSALDGFGRSVEKELGLNGEASEGEWSRLGPMARCVVGALWYTTLGHTSHLEGANGKSAR